MKTTVRESWNKDKFVFVLSKNREWRWQRFAVNGRMVGASTESYHNKHHCFENAVRNGLSVKVHRYEFV